MTEQLQTWYGALISALTQAASLRSPRVHDFSQQAPDSFAWEPISANQAYMTGQRRHVRRGDYILLRFGQKPELCQVQQIDYYASPSDMWTALLSSAAPLPHPICR